MLQVADQSVLLPVACCLNLPANRASFPLQVGRGSLVMDPFVGTGSCLVPAAHLGAYTIGTDIDVRVIKLGEWLRPGRICM